MCSRSFVRMITARRFGTIKVAKCKGHASGDMFERDRVCCDDKDGNDLADIVADIGQVAGGHSFRVGFLPNLGGSGFRLWLIVTGCHCCGTGDGGVQLWIPQNGVKVDVSN